MNSRFASGIGDKAVDFWRGVDNLTDDGVYCFLLLLWGLCFHSRGIPETSLKVALNRILQVANGMLVQKG